MDAKSLVKILTSFADKPADVDLGKGRIVLQVSDNVIDLMIVLKGGSVYVRETSEDAWELAEHWIINRIAKTSLLAECICENIPGERFFVPPKGMLLKDLNDQPDEQKIECSNSVSSIMEMLETQPAGVTRIIYLISDAGEGKTTLINELAREQAILFKDKKAETLIIPISLGGRPFMRLDDAIIGALVNQFRFRTYYYEALIELVKLGTITLALDGFEELFVENSVDETVSNLGNLIRALDSSGTILIASRKAYFEYRSLETQATLFDSISKDRNISLSMLEIKRWTKNEFLAYAAKRKIENANDFYNDIESRIDKEHPVLTRPVLVNKLLDLASDPQQKNKLIAELKDSKSNPFLPFIKNIIDRETTKWIEHYESKPLLSSDEHFALLGEIAGEMWNSSCDFLKIDVLELMAELFCNSRNKDIKITRQVKDRIKQHALLVSIDSRAKAYSFDHDEFKKAFLGFHIASLAKSKNWADFTRIMRVASLPELTIEIAIHELLIYWRNEEGLRSGVNWLQENACKEGTTSYLNENSGALISRLLNGSRFEIKITGITFPPNSLTDKNISSIIFERCFFQPTSLENTTISDSIFRECVLEHLTISSINDVKRKIAKSHFQNSTVRCIMLSDKQLPVYAPCDIDVVLVKIGLVDASSPTSELQEYLVSPDEELLQTVRMIRAFVRSTEINELVLRQKMGKRWAFFETSVLPALLDSKIIIPVPYLGGGQQNRYRINIPMQRAVESLNHSKTLADFVRYCETGLLSQ